MRVVLLKTMVTLFLYKKEEKINEPFNYLIFDEFI